MKGSLLLLLLTLASSSAWATILFLDFNNNPEEIVSARKAAAAIGETVVAWPEMPEKTSLAVRKMEKDYDDLKEKRDNACIEGADPAGCSAAKETFNKLDKAYDVLLEKIPGVDASALEASFASFQKRGLNFSKIIISGHQENGRYFGTYSEGIYGGTLRNLMKKYGICANTTAFYPWDCYTVSDKAIVTEPWKRACPNLKMLGSYAGRAPLGPRPSNLAYLQDLVTHTDEILNARSTDEAAEIFRSLAYVNDLNTNIAAGICLNGDTVIRRDAVYSLAEKRSQCDGQKEAAMKMQEIYLCYKNAAEGCEDVPDPRKDPAGKPSLLRQYYNELHDTYSCEQVYNLEGFKRAKTEDVIRLINDRNVRANFAAIQANELASMNKLIERLGLPGNLQLTNVANMTRRDWLNRLSGLRRAYNTQVRRLADAKGRVDEPDVLALGMYLKELRKLSDHKCVPSRWIDPRSTDESECNIKNAMGSAIRRADRLAERVREQRRAEGGEEE